MTSAENWSNDPPSPLSRPGPRVATSLGELPEVGALLDQGWELAPDAPFWTFLPAVWPRAHRSWLFDRSQRDMSETCDGASRVLPWTSDEEVLHESDLRSLCEGAGVSGWQPGRIWLLRVPTGDRLKDVLDRLVRSAEQFGVPVFANPDFVAHVRETLGREFAMDTRR